MRKSGGLAIPLTLIVFYYTFWITMMWYLLSRYPGLGQYFPIGGIEFLAGIQSDTFEPIYSFTKDTVHSPQSWVQLAIACVGAVILTIPVTWAYFITSRARRIDQSFLHLFVS